MLKIFWRRKVRSTSNGVVANIRSEDRIRVTVRTKTGGVFEFMSECCVKKGDTVKVGQIIGRWR